MNIKKMIVPVLAMLLFCLPAAADSEDKGSGQGLQTQVQQEVQNQGQEQQLQTSEQSQSGEGNATSGETSNQLFELGQIRKAQTINEVKEIIEQKAGEMEQEMEKMGEIQQKVYQNQNVVREAVHALLASEDLVEGIGPQVSQIAREFNNSVQATIKAEEKIQQRSMISRFFFGGEEEAAGAIQQEVDRNQDRIQEMTRLLENCQCGEEVKTMIGEQIQKMQQEQERLQQLAESEVKSNGIFGWIRNLFKI
jgi:hypothetical protein